MSFFSPVFEVLWLSVSSVVLAFFDGVSYELKYIQVHIRYNSSTCRHEMTKEPKSTGGCMHAFILDKQNSKTVFQHTLDFSRLQTLLQFLDNKHCIFYAFD